MGEEVATGGKELLLLLVVVVVAEAEAEAVAVVVAVVALREGDATVICERYCSIELA
jgi:hypothetical protein